MVAREMALRSLCRCADADRQIASGVSFQVEDEHPEWLGSATTAEGESSGNDSAEGALEEGGGTSASAVEPSDVDVPEDLREYRIS